MSEKLQCMLKQAWEELDSPGNIDKEDFVAVLISLSMVKVLLKDHLSEPDVAEVIQLGDCIIERYHQQEQGLQS